LNQNLFEVVARQVWGERTKHPGWADIVYLPPASIPLLFFSPEGRTSFYQDLDSQPSYTNLTALWWRLDPLTYLSTTAVSVATVNDLMVATTCLCRDLNFSEEAPLGILADAAEDDQTVPRGLVALVRAGCFTPTTNERWWNGKTLSDVSVDKLHIYKRLTLATYRGVSTNNTDAFHRNRS
jgi:hypothetical protein